MPSCCDMAPAAGPFRAANRKANHELPRDGKSEAGVAATPEPSDLASRASLMQRPSCRLVSRRPPEVATAPREMHQVIHKKTIWI
jgi:hypothetical protein